MTRMTILALTALTGAIFSGISTAHADTVQAEGASATVESSVGLFTPLGYGGLSLEYAPNTMLSVAAGLGMGLYGTQFSVMPRLHLFHGSGKLQLLVGAGVSMGAFKYERGTFIETEEHVWNNAIWANAEVSAAYSLTPNLRMRAFIGSGYLVSRDADECTLTDDFGDMPCNPNNFSELSALPYLGFGLGYQFSR